MPLLAVYCGVLAGNYFSARREVLHQAERYLLQLAKNDAANLDAEFRVAERAAESIASLAAEQTTETLERRADSAPWGPNQPAFGRGPGDRLADLHLDAGEPVGVFSAASGPRAAEAWRGACLWISFRT